MAAASPGQHELRSPKMTGAPKAVFLSYASQDGEAARRICDALRAMSVEVWFDQSALRGGDAWDASIRRQIRECARFVPIISANTQAREEGYFRREWNLAVNRHAGHGRRQGIPAAGGDRRDRRRERARAREVSRRSMDASARRPIVGFVRRARAGVAVRRRFNRDVIGRQCANAITGRGRSPRARARVDCGAAVRQPQQGRGRRVFFGRSRRRAFERAREDPRPARGGAHVVVPVQGQERGHRSDRQQARREGGARRQRAQGRQPDAHFGAARQRRRPGLVPSPNEQASAAVLRRPAQSIRRRASLAANQPSRAVSSPSASRNAAARWAFASSVRPSSVSISPSATCARQ